MRKIAGLLIFIIFLLIPLFGGRPLAAATHEDVEKINVWANNLGRQPTDPSYLTLHYRLRKLYFSVAPTPAHAVVFLGDSITYGGDWNGLFPDSPVENRGIGGDTTTGLLNRLDQVIAQKPARVFLMIGTNDLCYGRSTPNIVGNYRLILKAFHEELPDTKVYVESVLPFNDTLFLSRAFRTNDNIKSLNSEIKKLAHEYDCPYFDLAPSFTDSDGRLCAKYTSDGLHLSDNGYALGRELIKNAVATATAR